MACGLRSKIWFCSDGARGAVVAGGRQARRPAVSRSPKTSFAQAERRGDKITAVCFIGPTEMKGWRQFLSPASSGSRAAKSLCSVLAIAHEDRPYARSEKDQAFCAPWCRHLPVVAARR